MLVYIFLMLQFILGQTVKHQKPVAEKVWSVRCKKNEYVLNDCNWCWCGENHHFQCKARVCEEVDAFGHFKDTIQDLDVGMEGHGTWRSRLTSCTPGVQYQRGTVLCVCDEDGNWANPVCRDLFRILHSVEVTENVEESTSQTCSPTKLYLVSCNICFCPSSGKLDANLCTNRTCTDGDPVLEPKHDDDIEPEEVHTEPKDTEVVPSDVHEESTDTSAEAIDIHEESNDQTLSEIVVRKGKKELEVYAPCSTQKKYTIGRQNCECLTNNRLICREYHNIESGITGKRDKMSQSKDIVCSGKTEGVVIVGCNLCRCTSRGYMYCTTKKCLPRNKNRMLVLRKVPKFGKPVKAPIDDLDCIPGTSYNRSCNKCYCKVENGNKIFGCTVKACHKTPYDVTNMARQCVTGTSYETNCFICSCNMMTNGEKYEICMISPTCSKTLMLEEKVIKSLDSLHGYCEPRREYRNGCNSCRCLSNGKIVRCTTHSCTARSSEPVQVDIVPIQQAGSEPCPKGHSYKLECNLCFCLSNGNALCTTSDCTKQFD